ncbi:MAG: DUF362 domain-containing protein [Phycisphaerales bacterium]|nr:DUF362 domain-containing protein [Phycisphaerales bacterium]MCB9854192.1 DUF362 domain-containing protein [Phycisphaerales bacterium]MCB9864269.1 DUF362 domain-containing protein [Phycisphaerales bacterium]
MHEWGDSASIAQETQTHAAPQRRRVRDHVDRSLLLFLRSRASLLIGAGIALLWLLLRSGAKPSRLSYPCQQAAAGAATSGLLAPLLALRTVIRGCTGGVRVPSPGRLMIAGLAVVLLGLAGGHPSPETNDIGTPSPPAQPRDDYEADVFVIDNAQGPNGQNFQGLDDMIRWMGANGVPFYRSHEATSFVCGHAGIIALDDVVVIKINYQWGQRGGTNVDLLRGLIRRILDHPDRFVGEVVVCENAQFAAVSNFDRPENNAEDHALSPRDIVDEFAAQGHRVSLFDWTAVRGSAVSEFSAGDIADGYIVYAPESGLGGRVSYPKFTTTYGTHISLRDGIWDEATQSYDRDRLKFINVPVLKSHHAVYGATACVKNYMGVVTAIQNTNSHNATANGLLGALLAEIRLADLNILDCIWINANPFSGPSTSYADATRVDKIIAGIDPVAIDIWATKNVLVPAFLANGYSLPLPSPSADPDDRLSAFRIYLDNSMSRILASGQDATNDLERIHASRWDGDAAPAGDVNGDGLVDGNDIGAFTATLLDSAADPRSVLRSDVDKDGDLDGDDSARLIAALLGT